MESHGFDLKERAHRLADVPSEMVPLSPGRRLDMRRVFAMSAPVLVILFFASGLLGFNRLSDIAMLLSAIAIALATNPPGVVQRRSWGARGDWLSRLGG
jgi:hypothetical protein